MDNEAASDLVDPVERKLVSNDDCTSSRQREPPCGVNPHPVGHRRRPDDDRQ